MTNAEAPRWIKDSGLTVTSSGFLEVSNTLQSVSHPFVFGAGDVATVVGQERPKSGVFAVRQGRPLYANLRRYAEGKPMREVRLQKQFLRV